MMKDVGLIAEVCNQWNVPLLAMVYPRGPNIPDPVPTEAIASVARMAAELGADLVKTIYSGSVESFRKVVKGCPVPLLVAGGPKVNNDREILQMVSDSLEAGGAGVSLGRNIFQHPKPQKMVKALYEIIFDQKTVSEVFHHYLAEESQ
jgi:DhnA family fructose-bisphosphate aldolase class Ia